MVHWRALMEELAAAGALPPLVAFDPDLANMYGTIEWPFIRAAICKHFEEAEGWGNWAHGAVEEIELPGGATAFSDRGAGQGDVYGGTSAALVMGESLEDHRARMRGGMGDHRTGGVDEWYVDDGQGFVLASVAETWLKSVDQAITAFGGRRDTGEECKSVARLICPAGREAEFAGWSGGYICETCRIETASSSPKVLGAILGDSSAVTQQFRRTTEKVAAARATISILESAQCELVLQRRCFDVSKISYMLRCNGDRVDDDALREFDAALRGGTEGAIHGRLRDEGWV